MLSPLRAEVNNFNQKSAEEKGSMATAQARTHFSSSPLILLV
jgi:hypothetical protein